MRALPVSLLRRKTICLVFIAIVACDSFDAESMDPQNQVKFAQTEFYILPGSSTVIDLIAIIEKSFVSAKLTISHDPSQGKLTHLSPLILKYTPNYDFTEGQDQFIISAVLDDGTTIKSQPITIHMKDSESEFPCDVYSVEDNIQLNAMSTIVIHVLKNDHLCGVDEPVNVLVHLAPKFGEAVVVGDSIIYTPSPSFSQRDEFVYSLSTSSGEELSFGLVSFNKSTFQILEIPEGFTNIFFVDDMIGFIAGNGAIRKTVDGGRHWIPLTYPTGEDGYVTFEDIYFWDKDHGFAAFSDCSFRSSDGFCAGGWMRTNNGGVSWDRFDLNDAVSSIVFTSPLIGYTSTYSQLWSNFPEEEIPRSVFRTENGGQTWDEVGDLSVSSVGKVKFRFATDKVGCAYQNRSISLTTDGGKTWESFMTGSYLGSYVTSLAFVSEEVICANFATGQYALTPSTIATSEDGADWSPVTNFPYLIYSLGFSPQGDLGVAIGTSEFQNDGMSTKAISTISISTDKGKTWVDLAQHPVGRSWGWAISVPSSNVAYILCYGNLIKYTP